MWYFAKKTKRLGYGDGRLIIVGITHKVKGKPKVCLRGLHASPTVWDALQYAPGPILYKVTLGGYIDKSNDKSAASERTYYDCLDATQVLEKFARECALDVVHLWNAPQVVIDWLKTGDKSLREAANSAALSAAHSAANYAALSAARSAAHSATHSAAYYATYYAARSAARSAAIKKQKQRLSSMIGHAFKAKS